MLQPAIRRVPVPGSAVSPMRSHRLPAEKDSNGNGVRRVRLGGLSIGTSLCLHGTLLLILALLLVARREPRPAAVIDSVLLDAAPIEEPVFVGADLGGAERGRIAERVAIGELLTPSDEVLDLAAISGGTGDAGSGAGDGVGFFGTQAAGDSFVFIVDQSGSMKGARFERAVEELVASLRQLGRQQRFLVIFYNSKAQPVFYRGHRNELVPATRKVVEYIISRIRLRSAAGGTDPSGALALALSLRPDAIFLLTDGKFDTPVRDQARELNTHGAVIHTIAIGYRESEPILRGIAEDHGGRYRFVP